MEVEGDIPNKDFLNAPYQSYEKEELNNLVYSICIGCPAVFWIRGIAQVKDGIECDGEGTPEKAGEEEWLRSTSDNVVGLLISMWYCGISRVCMASPARPTHLDVGCASIKHLHIANELLIEITPDQVHYEDEEFRYQVEQGVYNPFSNEVEGYPVAPGLDVIANILQMLVLCLTFNEKLHHQGRCDESQYEDDIPQESEQKQFGKVYRAEFSNDSTTTTLLFRRVRFLVFLFVLLVKLLD